MRVREVEAVCLRLPHVRERSDGTQDAVIIKVTSEDGQAGYGEADSSPEAVRGLIEAPLSHSALSGLRGLLVGEDIDAYETIWWKLAHHSRYAGASGITRHALAGVDLALWDLRGKIYRQPVYRLLGGPFRTRFRAYASTLFEASPQKSAEQARRLADSGFSAVKFGWGPFGQSEREDEAQVSEIRKALGSNVDLLIDAGQCWKRKTALRMGQRLAAYAPFWLEEPLRPDDLDGYRLLSEQLSLRIAGGEAESDAPSLLRLMDRGGIDVVQIDVTRAGGLTDCKKIGFAAYDRARMVVNHSYTTDINVSASLHLLAALPDTELVEFCVEESPLRRQLTREPISAEGGALVVPEEPGLGITIDETVVDRYAVRI